MGGAGSQRNLQRAIVGLPAVPVVTGAVMVVLGAAGRTLAIADAGWPHPLFVVLMGLEYAVAPALVVWQARVAR